MGGLGGTNVGISEKEARYILQSYVDLPVSRGFPLQMCIRDRAIRAG